MTDLTFKTPGLSRAFLRFSEYLSDEGMSHLLAGGVLCGFSGGADSVLLLHLLNAAARRDGFRLAAIHVHHHLRGEEADRDEKFCEDICRRLSVPYLRCDVDVPAAVAKSGESVEEAARRLRYDALFRALEADSGLSVIATAHNATDNLETLLHHVLRGGALGALGGIHPVRGRLVRPLLCLTGEEIRSALDEACIPYVVDSTNSDLSLTRNYLRKEILPRLRSITPSPEASALRMCEALRHDNSYLDDVADTALRDLASVGDGVPAEWLAALPESIRRRVIRRLYESARTPEAATVPIEHGHITAISRLLDLGEPFSYAVPNRLFAHVCDGEFFFSRERELSVPTLSSTVLSEGENRLPGDFAVTVSHVGETVCVRCFSKLHKIDTTTAISSAIIKGVLTVRARAAGDSYRFFGHTHPLKKLFNEKKIPLRARACYPILCDDDGILWMPLCPPRDASVTRSE